MLVVRQGVETSIGDVASFAHFGTGPGLGFANMSLMAG
jgi:hypothetical protein